MLNINDTVRQIEELCVEMEMSCLKPTTLLINEATYDKLKVGMPYAIKEDQYLRTKGDSLKIVVTKEDTLAVSYSYFAPYPADESTTLTE